MFRNATPEKAVAFTRLTMALTYCWPLPSTASKFQVIRFKIVRTVSFLNIIMIVLPAFYTIYVHRDDAENASRACCLTFSFVKDALQMSFCIAKYEHFQRLIAEMKVCCEQANSFERLVLQRYARKYSAFYGMSAMWFYLTAFMVILGGLFTSERFPTKTVYPFAVDYEPLRTIILVHQAFVILQVASHVCVCIFCALMFLFTAARFDCLTVELREVKELDELVECVRKYYAVRRYADEVVDAFRFIAMLTVSVCALAAVLCGVTFLGHHPFAVKVPFFFVAATAFLEVFMCVWPADQLIEASENAMQGAYESTWYERSVAMQKSVLLLLVPQSPAAIRISCIIPIFSLNYYCSFISNVFSLFTALRVVVVNDEDNT